MTHCLVGKRCAQFSIFLFLFISFSAVINLTQAASKICQYCKKPVQTTEFLVVEGNYYCKNHFRCANCDQSIGEEGYFKENGRYYDHACYFQLFGPKCAVCSKVIDGKYTTFAGKNYHDSCYNSNIALRCGVCGEMINGHYITDFWGNNYHASHQGDVPECNSCQRYISSVSDSGLVYPDGRWACGVCAKTAITTIEQMNELVQEVRQLLLAKGIDVPFDAADNHLVGRQELAQMGEDNRGNLKGYAAFKENRIVFGLIPADRQVDVYLLFGLPKAQATYILSQSMMNLWLFRHGKRNAEQILHTGSAAYIGWLVMKDISSQEAAYILQAAEVDTDPLYGQGMRRIRTFANSQSMESFLKYLKKNKKMPEGY